VWMSRQKAGNIQLVPSRIHLSSEPTLIMSS
jgi:hypothetical protein